MAVGGLLRIFICDLSLRSLLLATQFHICELYIQFFATSFINGTLFLTSVLLFPSNIDKHNGDESQKLHLD